MNMEQVKNKRCYNCKWFVTVDDGYSNYTVIDTIVHCLQKLNKNFPMSESYSWKIENSKTKDHEIVKVAETCEKYLEYQNQIVLDVDGEHTLEDWIKDEELYEMAKIYFGNET